MPLIWWCKLFLLNKLLLILLAHLFQEDHQPLLDLLPIACLPMPIYLLEQATTVLMTIPPITALSKSKCSIND